MMKRNHVIVFIILSCIITITSMILFQREQQIIITRIIKSNSSRKKRAKNDSSTIHNNILSTTMGDHMQDIEYVPLQPWQKRSIDLAYEYRHQFSKMNASSRPEVCLPPVVEEQQQISSNTTTTTNTTILSSEFCCGGTSKKRRGDHFGHTNDFNSCMEQKWEDYERVRRIALNYTLPLLPQTKQLCDVCQIIETIRVQNYSGLVFIGDSVTHQMVYGLLCALRSRNYDVSLPERSLPQDATSFHFTVSPQQVKISFWNYYRLISTELWEDIFRTEDVVVFNIGLHWLINSTRKKASPERYTSELEKTFTLWSQIRKNAGRQPQFLFYRETSSQHFHSDSGEYFLWNQTNNESTVGCAPHQPTKSTYLGWRDTAFRTTAQQYNISLLQSPTMTTTTTSSLQMIMLPFLNFTSELYFSHRIENKQNSIKDCTHFCQSPYLWWPIWRHLRLSLDQTLN